MKRSCGLIVIVKKGNKSIMSLRTRSDALPAGFQKWNKLFDNLNWKKICYKTTKATNDTPLH